jgi:SRSO17 transposase
MRMLLEDPPNRAAEYLEQLHQHIGPRFARTEPRERALIYLRGLLSPVQRRNGWQLAAQGGEKYPDGMQRLLSSARWNADLVRDDLCEFVLGHAADRDSALIINRWQFHKKGSRSVGVHRRKPREGRRTENVQTGIFLTYASRRGQMLVDRELYLPGNWIADLSRRRSAHVPDSLRYRSPSELSATMIARTFAAGAPAKWVTTSSPEVTGPRLRSFLERSRVRFVVAVNPDERVPLVTQQGVLTLPVARAAEQVPPEFWAPLPHQLGSAVRPTPGRVWSRVRLVSVDPTRTARWLLLHRNHSTASEVHAYLCSAAPTTSLPELAATAVLAESNDAAIEAACRTVGLDQYEVRQWNGWYRYTTLAMAAFDCIVLADGDAASADAPLGAAPRIPRQTRHDTVPSRGPTPWPRRPLTENDQEERCPTTSRSSLARYDVPGRRCATR